MFDYCPPCSDDAEINKFLQNIPAFRDKIHKIHQGKHMFNHSTQNV
jgi:hypothetical protein